LKLNGFQHPAERSCDPTTRWNVAGGEIFPTLPIRNGTNRLPTALFGAIESIYQN